MESTFRFNTADINVQFLDVLKMLFANKTIEISVKEIQDDTSFLLNEPESRAFYLKAIDDLRTQTNVIKLNGEEYDQLVEELLKK
jgi:energy-coupling factor transporter ATP-binding protein EcfA2